MCVCGKEIKQKQKSETLSARAILVRRAIRKAKKLHIRTAKIEAVTSFMWRHN